MKKFDYASELNKVVKTEIKPTKIITDFNNLDSNIVVICEKLRNDGFLKEAIDLQQTYVQYKRAERELDGDKLLDLAHPKPTKIKDLNVEVKPIQDLKKDIMKLVGIKTAGADKTPKILNDAHPKPTKVLDTEVLSVQDCKEKIMKLVGIKNAGIKDLVRIIKKSASLDGYQPISKAAINYENYWFNKKILDLFLNNAIEIAKSDYLTSDETKRNLNDIRGFLDVAPGQSSVFDPYSYIAERDSAIRNVFNLAKSVQSILDANKSIVSFYYNPTKQLSNDALLGDIAGDLYALPINGEKYKIGTLQDLQNEPISTSTNQSTSSKQIITESPVAQQTPNTSSAPNKPLSPESMRHVWSSVGKYDLGNMPDNVKNNIKYSKDSAGIKYIYYRKSENSTGYMVWYENGIYYGWMNNSEIPNINKEKAKTNTVSDMLDGIDNVTTEHYVYRPSKTGGGDHYDAYFNGEFIGTFQNTTLSPVAYWKSHTLIARNKGYTLARSGKYWWKKNQDGKTYTAYRLDDPNAILQENVSMNAEPSNV